MATLDDNKAVIRRYYDEVLNRGDFEAADRLFGAGYRAHAPVRDPLTAEQYKGSVAMLRTAFPDLQWRIEELSAEGDRAAVRAYMQGTHLGPFQAIPATSKRVHVPVLSIYRIEGGRIAEDWPHMDMLGLLQQIGVMPAAGASRPPD